MQTHPAEVDLQQAIRAQGRGRAGDAETGRERVEGRARVHDDLAFAVQGEVEVQAVAGDGEQVAAGRQFDDAGDIHLLRAKADGEVAAAHGQEDTVRIISVPAVHARDGGVEVELEGAERTRHRRGDRVVRGIEGGVQRGLREGGDARGEVGERDEFGAVVEGRLDQRREHRLVAVGLRDAVGVGRAVVRHPAGQAVIVPGEDDDRQVGQRDRFLPFLQPAGGGLFEGQVLPAGLGEVGGDVGGDVDLLAARCDEAEGARVARADHGVAAGQIVVIGEDLLRRRERLRIAGNGRAQDGDAELVFQDLLRDPELGLQLAVRQIVGEVGVRVGMRAEFVPESQELLVVGQRHGPVRPDAVGQVGVAGHAARRVVVADVEVVGTDEIVVGLPLLQDGQHQVVDAGRSIHRVDGFHLVGLVHVAARGEDRRVAAHLQPHFRRGGVRHGPVDGATEQVVVGEHPLGGEVDVPAAGDGGEDRVGFGRDAAVHRLLEGCAGNGRVGHRDEVAVRIHGRVVQDLRRQHFRRHAGQDAEDLGADRAVGAVVGAHQRVIAEAAHDRVGGPGGANLQLVKRVVEGIERDAEQRLHAHIGIAGDRDGVAIRVQRVGQEVARRDQADAVLVDRAGQRRGDPRDQGAVHMGEGGEDDAVVLRELRRVGEVRLGQDVVGHAGHGGLVLGRHEQLRVGHLAEEAVLGRRLGIDDGDAQRAVIHGHDLGRVVEREGGAAPVVGRQVGGVVDVGVDVDIAAGPAE